MWGNKRISFLRVLQVVSQVTGGDKDVERRDEHRKKGQCLNCRPSAPIGWYWEMNHSRLMA